MGLGTIPSLERRYLESETLSKNLMNNNGKSNFGQTKVTNNVSYPLIKIGIYITYSQDHKFVVFCSVAATLQNTMNL